MSFTVIPSPTRSRSAPPWHAAWSADWARSVPVDWSIVGIATCKSQGKSDAAEPLDELGLDADEFLRHGRPRIVYGVALAENMREYLLGREKRVRYLLPPHPRPLSPQGQGETTARPLSPEGRGETTARPLSPQGRGETAARMCRW